MPRKPPQQKETPLTQLLIPRQDAEKRLKTQIDKGCEIRQRDYKTASDLQAGQEAKDKWGKYTEEFLKRTFSTEQCALEFLRARPAITMMPYGSELSLGLRIERLTNGLDYKIKALESIQERLDLIPETETSLSLKKGSEINQAKTQCRKVFVVHGHDEEAKQSVARLLEKLDLEAIILHERPNQGRTIIEKFEAYDEVGFAIVLFTPDDVGASKEDQKNLRPRARQNVVFELGYFIGKMGRSQVCVLHREPVEILSDYQGVLYIPMDEGGAWKMKLGQEFNHAGIKIDLNKLLL